MFVKNFNLQIEQDRDEQMFTNGSIFILYINSQSVQISVMYVNFSIYTFICDLLYE